MHLAAALGRPVIALYGITDPERTGPIGERCEILQHSAIRSRDVARDSAEAQKSLAAIRPETVYEAFLALTRGAAHDGPVPA
jgi:heptosyltransferase-1